MLKVEVTNENLKELQGEESCQILFKIVADDVQRKEANLSKSKIFLGFLGFSDFSCCM